MRSPRRKNTLLERMRRVPLIPGWRVIWAIDVHDAGRPVTPESCTGSSSYGSLEDACQMMRHFQKAKLKPRLKVTQFAP